MMVTVTERFVVHRDGTDLIGERWPGGATVAVLLHEGVADRRSWPEVASRLTPDVTAVAYDRRGFGETPVSKEPFTHLADLLAVLDQVTDSRVWLVGASAGGGLALDAALAAPDRVAGLVLISPAVSGAPEPGLDAGTQRFASLIDQAIAAADLDEANRLETWVWLDGPVQPEGRVGGSARALALDMNAIVLRNGAPEGAGDSGLDAWSRLAGIGVPVTVACGDLDVPYLVARSRELADRLPRGRHHVLTGMAHQPYLEAPVLVAQLILRAIDES